MFYLRVEREGGDQEIAPLRFGTTRIGREADNDVVLEDYGVSRCHAELVVDGGRVVVRDVRSRNGTLVVGREAAKLPSAASDGSLLLRHAGGEPSEVRLLSGDEVRLGRARLFLGETLGDGIAAAGAGGSPAEAASQSRAFVAIPAPEGETLNLSAHRAVALLDFVACFARDLSGPPSSAAATGALNRLRDFLRAERAEIVRLSGEMATVLLGAGGPGPPPPASLAAFLAEVERRCARGAPSRTVWLAAAPPQPPALLASLGEGAALHVAFAAGAPRPSVEELRSLDAAAAIAGQFLRLLAAVEGLERSNLELATEVEVWRRCADRTLPQPVAQSERMRRVLEEAELLASSPRPALLTGETGAGKEVVARFIHERSPRRGRHFVAVNCASLGTDLLESELFGHRRGAFTGAVADKAGLVELAAGGTLFLDEVGDLSASGQARILRLLEDASYRRVGDERERTADARVVAATNHDLAAEVAAGRFRQDLYYRLSVFPIAIPPLRERPEDLLPLARLFLDRYAREAGRPAPDLDVEASRLLHSWHWPGNARELRNVVERAAVLARGPVIAARHLLLQPAAEEGGSLASLLALPRKEAAEAFLHLYFERLLLACDWNVSRAARAAGVGRRNFHQLIARYGLRRPGASEEREAAAVAPAAGDE